MWVCPALRAGGVRGNEAEAGGERAAVTVEQIRAEIDERLPEARRDAHESMKIAPNSYGAGYDIGYWQALEEIHKFVNGEKWQPQNEHG